ncbi:MAG: carbonic anhydrase [Verrucomicrobia bacterium]|nr:MAG: carbonic anhydrase [Verrucomicrobiota bacterium]
MKHLLLRSFLPSGLLVSVLILSGCQATRELSATSKPTAVGDAKPPTKESQAAMTPQQAVSALKAGNERFVSGRPRSRNSLADVKATASGQYPFAVVLSCLDSRVPIELVLDQGIGDVFSARVAGNVLEEDVLGSMEFGCKAAGAKLIAVIGHSNCGAVKGAIDNVELGNLTALLSRIKPAIGQVPGDSQPRTSKNLEFVDHVAEANVRLVMEQIRERSPVLREMLDKGQIGLLAGMYDLSTGRIRFFE